VSELETEYMSIILRLSLDVTCWHW